MNRKHLKNGVTLLELLLVLAVAMVILTMMLRFARYHHNEVFVEQQKEAVAMTFLLMNQYYLSNCHLQIQNLESKTLQDLKAWASTSPALFTPQELALIPNNFETRYLGQNISSLRPHTVYQFIITASYAGFTTEQLQQLKGELNADSINPNNTLQWTRMPRQFSSKETVTNSLWIASMNMQAKSSIMDPTYGNACPQ